MLKKIWAMKRRLLALAMVLGSFIWALSSKNPETSWWTVLLIVVALAHAALFNGLNVAFVRLSPERLKNHLQGGDWGSAAALALLENPNRLLATILLGDALAMVALDRLSVNAFSPIAGVVFAVSGLFFLGELFPQCLAFGHSEGFAKRTLGVFRMYFTLLQVVTKFSASLITEMIGSEKPLESGADEGQHGETGMLAESALIQLISLQMNRPGSQVTPSEGGWAINALRLDDEPMQGHRLTALAPGSFVKLTCADPLSCVGCAEGGPPSTEHPCFASFVKELSLAPRKWAVLMGDDGEPKAVINVDGFFRQLVKSAGYAEFGIDPSGQPFEFHTKWHKPLVIDEGEPIGTVLERLARSRRERRDRKVVLVRGHQGSMGIATFGDVTAPVFSPPESH